MPWKKVDGKIVIGDSGNPVFVYPDGNEIEFDADNQVQKIRELTTKASKRKESLEALNATVSLLSDAGIETTAEGIKEHLKAAKKNAETVKNFKDSDMVKADEVEKIKKSVSDQFETKISNQKSAYEKQLGEKEEALQAKSKAIEKAIVRSAFLGSKFIRDKTSYPTPEIAFDHLRGKFTTEDINGETVGFGLDKEGNKLYSLKDPTSFASLDEAIEIIINTHPQKESLILADGGGTGADANKKKTLAGQKVIAKGDRVEFGKNIEDIASGKVKVEM